jgi:hypothetical protein
MIPQIEKTYPAGVNSTSISYVISAGVFPLIKPREEYVFTIRAIKSPTTFRRDDVRALGVTLRIDSTPVL